MVDRIAQPTEGRRAPVRVRVGESEPEASEDRLDAAIGVLVAQALAEDVGAGDWTTNWTVDPGVRLEGWIIAKEDLVVAGLRAARKVFQTMDPGVRVEERFSDGTWVEAGAPLMFVAGEGRAMLTAERTALNFLGRLSGIATMTRRFTREVEGLGARITDTRKTTPGWRVLEKWAVRLGGGVNHRMGLDDMILVKDNHIAAAGGVREAVSRVSSENHAGLPVEVEVTSVEQVGVLSGLRVDRILLDNMTEEAMRRIVAVVAEWPEPRPELEASGNMTLDRVHSVAETGVHWISVGALTHSASTADVSMRITPSAGSRGEGSGDGSIRT